MGDNYPVVKVAAVQAASVFLDREGSTEKACRLTREAGRNGARVIGFPEGFIPAHPVWYHHHAATSVIANRLAVELFKNSVEIPGPEIDALCAAAGDALVPVKIDVRERIEMANDDPLGVELLLEQDLQLPSGELDPVGRDGCAGATGSGPASASNNTRASPLQTCSSCGRHFGSANGSPSVLRNNSALAPVATRIARSVSRYDG